MPGTHLLPPNLLKLFAPRPPLVYTRPLDKDIDRVTKKDVSAIGSFIAMLKEGAMAGLANGSGEEWKKGRNPLYPRRADQASNPTRRAKKKRGQKNSKTKTTLQDKPQEDPQAVGDPYKTLFISRLHKNATENDLRREFEMYGTIERGRSRGYAFVVYERERDMKGIRWPANHGETHLGRCRRGRTVRGWKPRRLGGGLGGRPKPVEPSGGFRGGGFDRGRGGFRGGGRGFGGGRGGGGYGDRGGFGDRGGGGFRGGGGGGFRGRDDFGSPRGGGGYRGRGGGLGYQGGGFNDGPPPGRWVWSSRRGPGYGPPGGGGGGSGGYGGDRGYLKREGPGGFDDRDSKRPRY
ncbi:hypothetical protein BGW80DRAFT_1437429 [Lactifluus volemus]|nr:hypothetical protein BGW80DRAFT_1437429 [Lactifluus volemus]